MENDILIHNCNILDINQGIWIKGGAILIKDGYIKDIQLNGGFSEDYVDVDQVVDASGLWAIPGIIDSHVHLCEEARYPHSTVFKYDEDEFISGLRTANNLLECLSAGVTLVRDTGAYNRKNIKTREAVEQGIMIGPTVMACGNLITFPGGHFVERGRGERQRQALIQSVQEEVNAGADFIKVINDPEDYEVTLNKLECFPAEDYAALVNEAHRLGKKVAAHTFSREGIMAALLAKVDSLEHAVPLDDEMAALFIEQNVYIVPTYATAYDAFYFPKESLITPGPHEDSIKRWHEKLINNISRSIKLGVKIGIGSDAGCPKTDFRTAIREITFMTTMGMSNLQSIQAATVINAEILGIPKVGKLQKEFIANITLLRDNPLDSISALKSTEIVVVNGKVLISSGAMKN